MWNVECRMWNDVPLTIYHKLSLRTLKTLKTLRTLKSQGPYTLLKIFIRPHPGIVSALPAKLYVVGELFLQAFACHVYTRFDST